MEVGGGKFYPPCCIVRSDSVSELIVVLYCLFVLQMKLNT